MIKFSTQPELSNCCPDIKRRNSSSFNKLSSPSHQNLLKTDRLTSASKIISCTWMKCCRFGLGIALIRWDGATYCLVDVSSCDVTGHVEWEPLHDIQRQRNSRDYISRRHIAYNAEWHWLPVSDDDVRKLLPVTPDDSVYNQSSSVAASSHYTVDAAVRCGRGDVLGGGRGRVTGGSVFRGPR